MKTAYVPASSNKMRELWTRGGGRGAGGEPRPSPGTSTAKQDFPLYERSPLNEKKARINGGGEKKKKKKKLQKRHGGSGEESPSEAEEAFAVSSWKPTGKVQVKAGS